MSSAKIKLGDKFIVNEITLEVIGLKPGGKVELFDKENTRFTDRWHREVIKWKRAK